MLPTSDNAHAFVRSLHAQNQREGSHREADERIIELRRKNMEDDNMSENNTLKNLMTAFTGEAEANRKYTAYAKKAEKEGKLNVAKLFRAAADAETLHALKHFEVAGKI